MKKKYSAPDIAFESFSLSDSIANCEVGTNQNRGGCGYQFTVGIVIFLDEEQGCPVEIEDGSEKYNGICYDNPSSIKNLFNS